MEVKKKSRNILMIHQQEMLQIGISEQQQEIDKSDIFPRNESCFRIFLILFTGLRTVSNIIPNFLLVSVDRQACFGDILL